MIKLQKKGEAALTEDEQMIMDIIGRKAAVKNKFLET